MPQSRVLLLITARQGVRTSELADALRSGAKRALHALQIDGSDCRVLLPIRESEQGASDYSQLLEDGLGNGVKLGGVDAVLQVTAPGRARLPALISCLAEVRESAGPVIDSALSAAVAGTDVMIVKGTGPVELVYGMRRNPNTSHQAFCRYWKEQYTGVARFAPGLAGYDQLHANPQASKSAAAAAGVAIHDIDGVALQWFRSLQDFSGVVRLQGPLVPSIGTPISYKERATLAERHFSDTQRTTAAVVANG
jgi:hypothetical protein